MRTLTSALQALFQGAHRAHHVRVEVENGDGTLVDVTSRLVGWSYGQQVDDLHDPGSFRFSRGEGTDSLAPLYQASEWNRLDDGETYSPLLQLGRTLVFSAMTTALGEAPASYVEVYRGRIRRVNDKSSPIQVDCWDSLADTLHKKQIREPISYGDEGGDATLEEVIQGVLDDNGTGVTLWAPTPSDAGVLPYEQKRESVLQAVRTLAETIGWTTRSRWDEASGAFRWALYEPDRTASTPVWSFGPDRYVATPESDRAVDDVRNVIEVEYTDAETGARGTVEASDPVSIAEYDEVVMRLAFDDTDPINSEEKAEHVAAAALADLAEPYYTYGIELPYFWPAELGDLYEFTANGTVFTDSQTLAVVSVQHSGDGAGKARTTLLCRGKPAGARKAWIERSLDRADPQTPLDEEYGLVDVREVAASGAGKRRWAWTRRGRQVRSVWWAYQAFATPWTDDNWGIVGQQVQPLPPDQDWVEVDAPATGEMGALQIEPRLASLKVHNDNVIHRIPVSPVPVGLDVQLVASLVDNAVDLSLQTTAAAGSNPYPATAQVWEDAEGTGTLLAEFTLSEDGTKTKADDTDLGGRILPAEGKRAWFAVVTDSAGNVYRDKAEVWAPRLPVIDGVRSVLSSDLLSVDIYGVVSDPLSMGGTLEYWLPADTTTPPDPSGLPTGSVVISSGEMPYAFGPGTIAAFDNVVTAGNAFTVVLKFTAEDGRTTGAIPYPLAGSMQFLVDALGKLRAESVHNGLVLAEQYRPYYVGTGAPSQTPADYGTDRYFDSSALQPYKHTGSAWVVDNTTPAISYAPILRAGVVTAEVIAAGAVKAKLVGAERLTADNIDVLVLNSGQYIQSTSYVAGSSGWRINADGSVEFNSGTFRGTVVIGSGTTFEPGYDPSEKATVDYVDDAVELATSGVGAIIRKTSAPTTRDGGASLQPGDMWIDTNDGDRPYSWTGSVWREVLTEIDGGKITTGTIGAGVVFAGEVSATEFTGTGARFYEGLTVDYLGGPSPSGITWRYGLTPTNAGTIKATGTNTLTCTSHFNIEDELQLNGAVVSLGAADSGGAGYRVLRVPN